MTHNPHELSRTRKRLLEAAGEVFAEHGYRAATVRDICLHAKANVAAVNYHFRDKWALYLAAIYEAADMAMRDFPPQPVDPELTPEQKLAQFVHGFLLRVVTLERPAWHHKVLSRELIEPTQALDEMVNRMMRPTCLHLQGIVGQLLGPRVPQTTLRHCAMSIIGQITFICHSREAIVRLLPEQNFSSAAVDELAEHITRFSLAALREIRAQYSDARAGKTKSSGVKKAAAKKLKPPAARRSGESK